MVNISINNSVYDTLPNLILGFHGCNEEVYHKVIYEHTHLKKSMNAYDWLGNGIYFWEIATKGQWSGQLIVMEMMPKWSVL